MTEPKLWNVCGIFGTKVGVFMGILLIFANTGVAAPSSKDKSNLAERRAAALLAGESCVFDGEEVLHGDSVIAYLNSSGMTCQSEIRTCNDGVLSGTYNYASCRVQAPKACLFNGVTVGHDQQIEAFLNSSGKTCESEMRMCNNGALSGSFQFISCEVDLPDDCLFNGQPVASGSSVPAFLSSTVPFGATCQMELRQCDDGALSGTYAYGSCAPQAAATCLFNGRTVAHGEKLQAFQTSTVAYGQQCQTEERSCSNGVLSGTFEHGSCVPQAPASCDFNGQRVQSGQTVVAFMDSSVGYGDDCESEARLCTNGVLSGTFEFGSCQVQAPESCLFDGRSMAHGEKVVAFKTSTVPFGQSCQSETRTCSDGELSGSAEFASCRPNGPASCLFNGQTVVHGDSVQGFFDDSVAVGGSCRSEQRVCSNGVLSGTAAFSSCEVETANRAWINAKPGESARETCERVGMKPSARWKQGFCASGENRPSKGYGASSIIYSFGKFGNSKTSGRIVKSKGSGSKETFYCYSRKQKQDYKDSDKAVAYLCKKNIHAGKRFNRDKCDHRGHKHDHKRK